MDCGLRRSLRGTERLSGPGDLVEGINRSRSKEARYGGEPGLRTPEWRDCEPLHHKLLITPVAWPKDEGVGRSQASLGGTSGRGAKAVLSGVSFC